MLIPIPCRILLQINSKLVPRAVCGLAIGVHYLHFWSAHFRFISVIESSLHTQETISEHKLCIAGGKQVIHFRVGASAWIKTIMQTTFRGSKHPEEQTVKCSGYLMWSRMSLPRNRMSINCSHCFSSPDTL